MNDLLPDNLSVDPKEKSFLAAAGLNSFEDFMGYPGGTLVARKRGRTVARIAVEDRAFFLKRNVFNLHLFIKSLLRFRWPSRSALNEWNSIVAVQKAGIPCLSAVAVGEDCLLGVERESFTLTEELYGAEPLDVKFERDFHDDLNSDLRHKKRDLIRRIAGITRQLHCSGMCHQDLYLGHFFHDHEDNLFLIDLQRVLRWHKVPLRYIVKDLAQMAYSARVVGGFTRSDHMRFLLTYLGNSSLSEDDRKLIRRVMKKCDRIDRHTVKHLARRRKRGEVR